MKTLLFVSGGTEMIPGINKAREMGLRVVVSDRDPKAPGILLADEKIIADTYDAQGTLNAVRNFQQKKGAIDGVLCLGADVPFTVTTLTAALGLPGISLDSARLSADKLAMKKRFLRDGVNIPWFAEVTDSTQLQEVLRTEGAPLVVKPVDSRGARGVTILTDQSNTVASFREAKKYSPSNRVMAERFLEGPQVSTESMVVAGEIITPGFSDRNYEFLEKFFPHIIENGGELPSKLSAEIQNTVHSVVEAGIRSMGVDFGVVKGDIVIHNDHPFIIELATRLSGGYFCTHEIPLNVGVDFVGCAIRAAIGEEVAIEELKPKFQKAVAQRYLFPPTGVVKSIHGLEQVLTLESIELAEVRVRPGDIIGSFHNHPARAGVIIATGETRDDAILQAENAVKMINIFTE